MGTIGEWEQLRQLGEGGQSRVFLVRNPSRVRERRNNLADLLHSNPWAPYAGSNPKEPEERAGRVANSIWSYARSESLSDLGALKIFKIPDDSAGAAEALGRLKNEITVLRGGRPGLVRLLEANETERWVVTEYMPLGTLDNRVSLYKGEAARALRAFRSLVETVAGLHRDGLVHRDIKPANVFLAEDGRWTLGDFGIVFMPGQPDRLTVTDERVGPRDYMPQWGDLGERLENVRPSFDVYMLGKLLWCMVAGRLKLPREYHDRPAYDLKMLFPNDPNMHLVDAIVKKCVVEEPEHCLTSGQELLALVNEHLAILDRGGQLLEMGVPRPCRVCGKGQYRKLELEQNVVGSPVVNLSMAGKPIQASVFECDNCHHIQLFAAN